MKFIKLLLIFIAIMLLTGCWNYRELEDLAIVGAVGIDRNDKAYHVSIEVINPQTVASNSNSGAGMSETPTIVYESSGMTIREALNNIVLEAPYSLYLGHLNLLVISEPVAKHGIYDIIDFFMRDIEVRKIFPVVVVKNAKASDVLKILKPLETVTAVNIKSSLEAAASINSFMSNRVFDEILTCLYVEGRHPTISAIEVINFSEEGQTSENLDNTDSLVKVKITGSAILKQDKLVGYLDGKEGLAFTIIRNNVQSMTLSFPCDEKDNYATVVIDKITNDLKIDMSKNKPIAKINIKGTGALVEYNCKSDLNSQKDINQIKSMVVKELTTILETTVEKTQNELKSDVFGFGERIYKDHNSYWKKNKDNWDEKFSKMEYKIKTDIKIERTASIVESAKNR